MSNNKWYTGHDAMLIEMLLDKYRGKPNNPLNGLSFYEILENAKTYFQAEVDENESSTGWSEVFK